MSEIEQDALSSERKLPIAPGDKPTGSQDESTLEDLLRAVSPVASAYFETQERMQERELAFDTKVLEESARSNRHLLVAGVVLALAVFMLASVLIFNNRIDAALDLIGLVVAVAGAAFGGYGMARARQYPTRNDD